MATPIEVPTLGESVTQAILVKWHHNDGDYVKLDEPLCELETDKANVDIPAKVPGVLRRLKNEGDTVAVGESVASIEAGAAPLTAAAPKTPSPEPAPPSSMLTRPAPVKAPAASSALQNLSPAVRRVVEEHHLNPADIKPTGPGGRITKQDAEAAATAVAEPPAPAVKEAPAPPYPAPSTSIASRAAQDAVVHRPAVDSPVSRNSASAAPLADKSPMSFSADGTHRAPMSKIRKKIAQRLVQAQQTAAILTTFNEVDLTEIIALRARYKEQFEKVHGVGLGFMSFFARACVQALKELPRINAFIDGDDVVYHQYINLGIAVSTERGLAVPVLRNVQDMSFARIESEIKRLAIATRDGKLSLEELSGGTFSITNGGIFGSLLSTPILNMPQSGILGMHAIQKRPMVVGDRIEIRSMMYLALSYDHRIVDGKEAITFLVRLKQQLEDPARLMLEI